MKNKFVLILISLVLISSSVFAVDYNYSKDFQIPIDVNILVNTSNNSVTIQTSSGTNNYSTLVDANYVITVTNDFTVTQDHCPAFSEITEPLIEALNESSFTDINGLVKLVEDSNNYASSCANDLDSAVSQLGVSINEYFRDQQAYWDQTLLPNVNEINGLEDRLSTCETRLQICDSNVASLKVSVISLQGEKSNFESTKRAIIESADTQVLVMGILVLILVIILVVVALIHFGYIGNKNQPAEIVTPKESDYNG